MEWIKYIQDVQVPEKEGQYLCLILRSKNSKPYKTFAVKSATNLYHGRFYFTTGDLMEIIAFRKEPLSVEEINLQIN